MIYTIINPSDPYTLHAEEERVAIAACLILGEGRLFLNDEKDNSVTMPSFLDRDPNKSLRAIFPEGLNNFIESNLVAVTASLDSVACVGLGDRRIYDLALAGIKDPEAREKFRLEEHDRRRSSMSDIGGIAWRLAAYYRKTLQKEEAQS